MEARFNETKSASRITNQLSGSSQIATNNQVKDENHLFTFNQEKYGNNPLLDPDFKLNISWANDIITWDQEEITKDWEDNSQNMLQNVRKRVNQVKRSGHYK